MKTIGIVAVLSALLTAGNAFAEANYPDQPLRIVVGFVAGGPAALFHLDLHRRLFPNRLNCYIY